MNTTAASAAQLAKCIFFSRTTASSQLHESKNFIA